MHMGSRAEAFKKRKDSVSHHELLDVKFDRFSLEDHVGWWREFSSTNDGKRWGRKVWMTHSLVIPRPGNDGGCFLGCRYSFS